METRNALLWRETMNTAIEVCSSGASGGAEKRLKLVLLIGNSIGTSCAACPWRTGVDVRIALDESLESMRPVARREFRVVEEDRQVLQLSCQSVAEPSGRENPYREYLAVVHCWLIVVFTKSEIYESFLVFHEG